MAMEALPVPTSRNGKFQLAPAFFTVTLAVPPTVPIYPPSMLFTVPPDIVKLPPAPTTTNVLPQPPETDTDDPSAPPTVVLMKPAALVTVDPAAIVKLPFPAP